MTISQTTNLDDSQFGKWPVSSRSWQEIRHFVKSNCSRDFYRAEFSRMGKLDILHVKNLERYRHFLLLLLQYFTIYLDVQRFETLTISPLII